MMAFRAAAAIFAMSLVLPAGAQAQSSWPNKPVKILVPTAPGGTAGLAGAEPAGAGLWPKAGVAANIVAMARIVVLRMWMPFWNSLGSAGGARFEINQQARP